MSLASPPTADLLHALRRLAGSTIAASLGPHPPDRAAALAREAALLAIAVRSAVQLPTLPAASRGTMSIRRSAT